MKIRHAKSYRKNISSIKTLLRPGLGPAGCCPICYKTPLWASPHSIAGSQAVQIVTASETAGVSADKLDQSSTFPTYWNILAYFLLVSCLCICVWVYMCVSFCNVNFCTQFYLLHCCPPHCIVNSPQKFVKMIWKAVLFYELWNKYIHMEENSRAYKLCLPTSNPVSSPAHFLLKCSPCLKRGQLFCEAKDLNFWGLALARLWLSSIMVEVPACDFPWATPRFPPEPDSLPPWYLMSNFVEYSLHPLPWMKCSRSALLLVVWW